MNANISNAGDVGEMITKMLSDPESLGKVMNMVGALSASGVLSGVSTETSGNEALSQKPEHHSEHKASEDSRTAYSPTKDHDTPCRERPRVRQCDRIRLLEAMRPFLGEDKRVKLDMVIKLLGLAEAAGGLYSFKM